MKRNYLASCVCLRGSATQDRFAASQQWHAIFHLSLPGGAPFFQKRPEISGFTIWHGSSL